MNDVIGIAVLLAAFAAAQPAISQRAQSGGAARQPVIGAYSAVQALTAPNAPVPAPFARLAEPDASVFRAVARPGEDKFRHAAMSWAVTAFTYAAARAAERDAETALAIAVPVSAAAGLGKELADVRAGGPFSAGDILADLIGTGIAYVVLREVR